jgi:hypothetical protein
LSWPRDEARLRRSVWCEHTGEARMGRSVSVHRKRGSMGRAQATALIVPVITVVGAVVTVVITYGLNQRAGRRGASRCARV